MADNEDWGKHKMLVMDKLGMLEKAVAELTRVMTVHTDAQEKMFATIQDKISKDRRDMAEVMHKLTSRLELQQNNLNQLKDEVCEQKKITEKRISKFFTIIISLITTVLSGMITVFFKHFSE